MFKSVLALKLPLLTDLWRVCVRMRQSDGLKPDPPQAKHEPFMIHPPVKCLPPNPPPTPLVLTGITKFPALVDQKGKLTGRLQENSIIERPKPLKAKLSNAKRCSSLKGDLVDVGVLTDDPVAYVCLLCGAQFGRGDVLYAHLLVLAHYFLHQDPHSSIQFCCRRCGQHWTDGVTPQRMSEMERHGCVQQKAAFLSKFAVPNETFKKCGLPFICLFCCAEPTHLRPWQYRPSMRNSRSSLAPCESAMRFESKLHLAVHIMCCHSSRSKPGSCGECSFQPDSSRRREQVWEANQFWSNYQTKQPKGHKVNNDTGSTSSESDSDPPRPVHRLQDSISERQGLSALEKHADEMHLPLFKFLSWLVRQHRVSLDRQRPEVYACPLCELMLAVSPRRNPTSQGDLASELNNSITERKHQNSNNALFQAHLACYHAGSRQLDMILDLCQVCGHTDWIKLLQVETDFNFRGAYAHGSVSHLLKSGHARRLKQEFARCVQQGRVSAQSVHCAFDWETVCLFCWQRFTTELGPDDRILYARCALQVHLIVAHAGPVVIGNDRGCRGRQMLSGPHQVHNIFYIGRKCGWCGQTPEFKKAIDKTIPIRETPPLLRELIESDQQWEQLYTQYQWFEAHEKAHANALYDWWSRTRTA